MYVLILLWDLHQELRYLFFLLICGDELISTPKIITFLPTPLPNENSPFLSNPILHPKYLYLPIPAFLIKLTAPNKPFSSVG